jgi:ABC-type polysaccharide/polyol phosphate transport system ATPase subunit
MSAALVAEDLGVKFYFDRQSRVVTPMMAGWRRRGTSAWGIRGINFSVGNGESVALLGPSGAGKTTLLRTAAGVLAPDEGDLFARGRIASLLSVDAGLMPTLTGHENALLLSVLAGVPRRDARRLVPRIRERAGLHDEFDHPVSSYSQGMRARLAFAVSEQTDPEILLLDEVHEALDYEFRQSVEQRAAAVLRAGGVVIAAGHDHELLSRLCGRALLLKQGALVADGDFAGVQQQYVA